MRAGMSSDTASPRSPIAEAQARIVSGSQPVTATAAFTTVAQPTDVTASSHSAKGEPDSSRAPTTSSPEPTARSASARIATFASRPREEATRSSASASVR